MPYYMILKAEVNNPTELPGVLESVAKDLINGMTTCHTAIQMNKGEYHFTVYKPNTKEEVNVDTFVKGAHVL